MSGTNFLLDTNFIIGLLKGQEQVTSYLDANRVPLNSCAYSSITRIELLSYPSITEEEVTQINHCLDMLTYIPISRDVEEQTIRIRRASRLKTPDAIIAATALEWNLELLTLDAQLKNQLQALEPEEAL